jgi:hypothetical protein
MAHITMSRGITQENVPFRIAVSLRTQAHSFLRLALNSDDREVQKKYLNAAREVLAKMEVVIEKVRSQNLAEASSDSDSESKHDSKSEDDEEGVEDFDKEEESGDVDEERNDESEEDWGDEDNEDSEEEEWDINNGEISLTPPPTKQRFETHYFVNGPGKQGLFKDAAPVEPVNLQHKTAANNLDIRVYARLMELFEIESRHRLEKCNTEQALRIKVATESLAELNMSKLVSDPIWTTRTPPILTQLIQPQESTVSLSPGQPALPSPSSLDLSAGFSLKDSWESHR